MGQSNAWMHVTVDGIRDAGEGAKCDVCGRTKDVAEVIGILEGPPDMPDGLANVVYLCSYCGARIVQATTGFQAVKTLYRWYRVHKRYPSLSLNDLDKVGIDQISIG